MTQGKVLEGQDWLTVVLFLCFPFYLDEPGSFNHLVLFLASGAIEKIFASKSYQLSFIFFPQNCLNFPCKATQCCSCYNTKVQLFVSRFSSAELWNNLFLVCFSP